MVMIAGGKGETREVEGMGGCTCGSAFICFGGMAMKKKELHIRSSREARKEWEFVKGGFCQIRPTQDGVHLLFVGGWEMH